MTRDKRVARNVSWIIGCRIVQALLGAVITMISARYLGPSGFGLINYAASIITFVVPLMQLGLTGILVQEIVESPEQEGQILGTAMCMSFVSGMFCIVGVITFAMVANAGETVTIITCALYSVQLIFQSVDVIRCWFQAKLMSKYVSVTVLIGYFLTSVYKIILLATGSSVYWFALAQTLDHLVISATLLIIYSKIGTQKLGFSYPLAKKMFAKSKYYIISSMMVVVFAHSDRIMLKMMLDDAAVGYYSAAVTCAGITSFVFSAIIESLRPYILEKRKKGKAEFENGMTRLYCVVIYLSLIQSIGMTLFSRLIVRILYGSAFDQTVFALRIIVWYTTFSYLGAAKNIWVLAEGQYRYLWQINMYGAIANILLNALMIPAWGVNGAAIATLVTQVFTNFIVGFFIREIRPNNILILKAFRFWRYLN